MKLTWTSAPLPMREPFRISRSVTTTRDAFTVTLHHTPRSAERAAARRPDSDPDDAVGDHGADGSGHGEVVTSARQGLGPARIDALLRRVARWADARPDLATLLARLPELADGPGAPLADAPGVLAAVDAAAHDLRGRDTGQPVHALLGEPAFRPTPTAYTIGITSPAAAATRARRLAERGFTVLKVKAGSPDPADDLARLAAVHRAAPGARVLLDPNGAWSPDQAVRLLDRMAEFAVEAVEQPVAPGTLDRLAWVAARSPVPVVADEDARTAADIPRLAGVVHGVNLKLAECGGIAAAVRCAELAAAHGLDVMFGCLAASSLGLAPAVHLADRARWIDLDGHLLIARDPWTGIGGEDGVLRLSGAPGLGVRRRAEAP
ncbi:dipeptide epimerase [Streptodolium elevatio]|uniref:Dipeptide epimerase n=1 Tax=Streptodolium elevatio TaxID=3157996 RepID=A0ABV3DDZ8_9ACTN